MHLCIIFETSAKTDADHYCCLIVLNISFTKYLKILIYQSITPYVKFSAKDILVWGFC